MNYFELYGLPVSFVTDKNRVRKKYLELSKKYHPDYFAQAGESEQALALETSAALNKAMKIFSDRQATIKYVLTVKGLLEEEEKYSLPPAFLMEMMDINEKVAEVSFDPDPDEKKRVEQQMEELEKELYEPVKNSIENYTEGVTSREALLEIKDYYFKKKYLARIYEALRGML